ncbi:sensor histidine kinase [Actinoplanes rectilineatus]|uniref:sensor histidine kinase n=1 Tax=Actinoplanes rectilineatus TaxID=113571 RepID=UPI00069617DA|nr:HAMP domain-containing sensor histidine kinase [Actinoplanes rectilineatus]
MSVIRRLLLSYLSLTLVVLVALALPLGYMYQRGEQQHALSQLEHDAETLAAFIDTPEWLRDEQQIQTMIADAERRWNARVERLSPPGEPDPDGETPVYSHIGDDWLTVMVPIHPGKPSQGSLRVRVSGEPLRARIHQFRAALVAVAVAVLGCGALIATALARWIGRPVRELERATRSLADGGTPVTASTTTGPPELRRLAATFNTTAARLQELIAAQRSFVGHASHQLKTPLTALVLRLENLEDDVAAPGRPNLRAALHETGRLSAMVDNLLAMTRGELPLPPEPVALGPVVAERIAVWRPVAGQRSVTLVVDGPFDVAARAVPGAVEQILDNLLSNALNVAPAGSTVVVRWLVTASTVEIHVVDAGPGLTEEERGLAVQAFWRAPGAPKGGTGLGLALVGKLAASSGGEVRLEAARDGGLDAVVTLPTDGALFLNDSRKELVFGT